MKRVIGIFPRILYCVALIVLSIFTANAANDKINFIVHYKTVNFTGKPSKAIVVNNQIPAPTLHFKEGDTVTINVHNQLDQETAIHWHGLILPWQMDGVLGISQQGIPPGGTFQYHFTLHQSGTYWYHAHAGLQEQQGLYGALIIDPLKHPTYHYTKDYTVVLSDWSNTNPDQILANLKKEGDYYASNFPLQPSLIKFIHDYRKASVQEKKTLLDDYKMMQQMRMSVYDFSDVAYDSFLLNGQTKAFPWTAPVKVGDVVRLRFIGAGGSTIFHVKIPDTTMEVVHIQGNDIKPYALQDFTIAPGETLDVLVKINNARPYVIYAESTDTVGAAYGALISSPHQVVNYKSVTRFPEPLPVTREMMVNMMGSVTKGLLPAPKNKAQSIKSNHAAHNPSISTMPHHMKMDDHSSHSMDNMAENHSGYMAGSMPGDNTHSNHQPFIKLNLASSAKLAKNMPMGQPMSMNHTMGMKMPTEPTIIGDSILPPNSTFITYKNTKYQNIQAAIKTNDPNKPIAGVINMELFGYMDRYVWFINGVPEHKAHPVVLEPAKRYRFVFTNTSMMHHPMHIHGHWFILRKGAGSYDPLLHTIDVPPGATITADVDTDASGQWIFHCHLLYHMMAGMARTIQYSTLLEIAKDEAKPQNIVKQTLYYNRPIVRVDEVRPINFSLIKHPMAHPNNMWFATFLDVGANPVTNVQQITFKGLYGYDYNKLELFANDAEIKKGSAENADLDIFYWHLLDQFWAIKGGVNYFYRPTQSPYWQPGVGLEGLLPYFIDTDIRGYFYSGSAKLDVELSRDTQITNNFFIRAGIRSILASKTVIQAERGSGLNQMQYTLRPYYRLMPGLDFFTEFESDHYYGVYRNLQKNAGNSTSENTLTLGLSMLF